MSCFVTKIIKKESRITALHLSYADEYIKGDYNYIEDKVFYHSEKITLNLERIRSNKLDDLQSITALHESGHAILSATLLHTIPEVIYSRTADADTEGFVYTHLKWEYVARN